MAKIKFSSPLQLARYWDSDPEVIAKKLVQRRKEGPKYSYHTMYGFIRDILNFNVDQNKIIECIKKNGGTKYNKRLLIDLVPYFFSYYNSIQCDYCIEIQKHSYPLWTDMHIPFHAEVAYGCSGKLIIPHNIFWKTNPLSEFQLSIFKTICIRTMQQSSDLEAASLDIIDFSRPKRERGRRVRSIDENAARILSHAEIREVADAFRKGVELAQRELDGRPASSRGNRKDRPDGLGDQPSFDF